MQEFAFGVEAVKGAGSQTGGGEKGVDLGAVNSDENRHLVTAAIGFRSKITDSIQTGLAYEMPRLY